MIYSWPWACAKEAIGALQERRGVARHRSNSAAIQQIALTSSRPAVATDPNTAFKTDKRILLALDIEFINVS